jgi:hypothetical protein
MAFFMAQPLLVQCQLQAKESAPASECCASKSKCKKAAEKKKTENKDCDQANTCNPFAGCSQCHYIAASKFFYPTRAIQKADKSGDRHDDNIASGFSADFWQPPELIPA